MRVMRTLYVTDHAARIRVQKGNVVVKARENSQRVPIETLEAVVLTGRADLTNDAIGELTRRGVRISAISKGGKLRFWIGGPTQGNVQLRLGQYNASTKVDPCLRIARMVVAGKLQNCRRMMQRWAWDQPTGPSRMAIEHDVGRMADRLQALQTAPDGDTIRGIEGDGSRRYFRAMSVHLGEEGEQLHFPRRSRRPPRDPANALLGFTYGLVLSEVVGATESVGLDPQVGFLHRPRSGRPSLALDLLEEFRPSLADRFVVALLRRRQVTGEDFERRAGGGVYLSADGRRKVLGLYDAFRQTEVDHPLLERRVPVALLPSIQATLMARHLRGDLKGYPSYLMAA